MKKHFFILIFFAFTGKYALAQIPDWLNCDTCFFEPPRIYFADTLDPTSINMEIMAHVEMKWTYLTYRPTAIPLNSNVSKRWMIINDSCIPELVVPDIYPYAAYYWDDKEKCFRGIVATIFR